MQRQDNENFANQLDEWQRVRGERGENATDWDEFRAHLGRIGAPDPGNIPTNEFTEHIDRSGGQRFGSADSGAGVGSALAATELAGNGAGESGALTAMNLPGNGAGTSGALAATEQPKDGYGASDATAVMGSGGSDEGARGALAALALQGDGRETSDATVNAEAGDDETTGWRGVIRFLWQKISGSNKADS